MKRQKKGKHTRTEQPFRDDYITETKDFAGVIVQGDDGVSKKLKINSSTWYQTQLNKFRVGEKVTMYISSKRPKRSLQQNSYYWGVYLPLIAKETGEHSIERLHQLFSGKFLTKEITTVLGEPVRIKKSTTELTKATFSEYIMDIEAFTGISAPPTEGYFD